MLHPCSAKNTLGLESIVRRTQQAQILHRVRPTSRHRLAVIDLDIVSRSTTLSIDTHESATPIVPLEDRISHGRWDRTAS